MDRSAAYVNTFHIATYQPIDGRQTALLSPARLAEVIDSFLRGYNRYGISGLALGIWACCSMPITASIPTGWWTG